MYIYMDFKYICGCVIVGECLYVYVYVSVRVCHKVIVF